MFTRHNFGAIRSIPYALLKDTLHCDCYHRQSNRRMLLFNIMFVLIVLLCLYISKQPQSLQNIYTVSVFAFTVVR